MEPPGRSTPKEKGQKNKAQHRQLKIEQSDLTKTKQTKKTKKRNK